MKIKYTCLLFLFNLTFFAVSTGFAQSEVLDFNAIYESAQQAYYKQDYDRALENFQTLHKLHPDNPAIDYNLGNVYFQKGDFGLSRLFYEKAKLQIPRFANLRQNLTRLLQELKLPEEKSLEKFLEKTFYFWQNWLNFFELQILVMTLAIVLSVILIFKLKESKMRFGILQGITLIFYVYFLFGVYLKSQAEMPFKYGVVLESNVEVKSNYLDQSDALFTLPVGTKIKIVSEQIFGQDPGWYRVEIANSQKGWTLKKNIGVI